VGVSEGDQVVFAKYSGTKTRLDDEDHLILNSNDPLGVVEE
jgi:co-chaperonin GroES (HSP10)